MTQLANQNNLDKALSIIAHGAALLTSTVASIIVPIAILAISEDDVVKANARESINFQISLLIYALVGVVLSLVGIGFIVLIVVGLWSLIAPLFAMLNVANNPTVPQRYSLIFHFIK
jgi:uncharacterized protein